MKHESKIAKIFFYIGILTLILTAIYAISIVVIIFATDLSIIFLILLIIPFLFSGLIFFAIAEQLKSLCTIQNYLFTLIELNANNKQEKPSVNTNNSVEFLKNIIKSSEKNNLEI